MTEKKDEHTTNYIADLKEDVREWRNIIITELKERYTENKILNSKISELEIKLTEIENKLENISQTLNTVITEDQLELQNKNRMHEESKKGLYAIIVAMIAAFGTLISSILQFLFSN